MLISLGKIKHPGRISNINRKLKSFAKSNLIKIKKHANSILFPHNKPNFLIIGAQKCGTSSLHNYLSFHPDFKPSLIKELHFFNRMIYFGESFENYLRNFSGPKNKLYYESTPAYLYHPDTAANIYGYLKDVKMIVLLRDPVRRAYSAWNHYRQLFESGNSLKSVGSKKRRKGSLLYEKFFKDRAQFPSFRECIEIELALIQNHDKEYYEPALIRRGLYLRQLQEYWHYFPKDEIKIIGFDDFINNPIDILNKIVCFIGASGYDWANLNLKPANKRQYIQFMSNEDEEMLTEYFREENLLLFKEIGELNW